MDYAERKSLIYEAFANLEDDNIAADLFRFARNIIVKRNREKNSVAAKQFHIGQKVQFNGSRKFSNPVTILIEQITEKNVLGHELDANGATKPIKWSVAASMCKAA